MSSKERRKYPRIGVRWAVSVLTADGLMQGIIEDIGLAGAFISCEMPPKLNEKVILHYSEHSRDIQDIAQVVWTNLEFKGTRDKPTGMGVKFLATPQLV
jgi:hypothetical protein